MVEVAHFIKALPFFRNLPEADIQRLLDTAKIKAYPKKTSIFKQGDPAERFFIVMNGWVKLCQTTRDGNKAILTLFTRGDCMGEAVIVGDSAYPYNAEAVEETRIIELSAKALRDTAAQNHDLSLRLMQSMTHHIRKLHLENEHLAVMTTTQRAGCLLLQMCLGMQHYDGHFRFPYDKHLAAAKLGMKPETFSRALKDLQKYGVHVKGDDITIESLEKLENHCCSNCSDTPDHCILAQKNLCQCENQKQKTG